MKRTEARVLHLTESLGGGVQSALESFLEGTPQYRHYLVGRRREGSVGDIAAMEVNADAKVVSGSLFELRGAYISALKELKPDIVHLHSSWAGLLGRSVRTDVPIVYSPHCFFHARTDIPRSLRRLARSVEGRLGSKTTRLIGVSPWEAAEGESLGIASSWVENRLPSRLQASLAGRAGKEPGLVVMAGRISRQKDPHFFLEVKRVVDERLVGVKWRWIGDGNADQRSNLLAGGVEVTGWLPRIEAKSAMGAAAVYFHSAAWEAAPLTLVEADELGVPIVVRREPSLASLGWDGCGTVQDAAERIIGVLSGGPAPAREKPATLPAELDDVYSTILRLRS